MLQDVIREEIFEIFLVIELSKSTSLFFKPY